MKADPISSQPEPGAAGEQVRVPERAGTTEPQKTKPDPRVSLSTSTEADSDGQERRCHRTASASAGSGVCAGAATTLTSMVARRLPVLWRRLVEERPWLLGDCERERAGDGKVEPRHARRPRRHATLTCKPPIPQLSLLQRLGAGRAGERTRGLTMTKSALHFPVDRPLPKKLVKKLIDARLQA